MSKDEISGEGVAGVMKAALENIKPEVVSVFTGTHEAASVLVLPEGMRTESLKPILDAYRDKPKFRVGTEVADRLVSFIDLTNRFKADNSAVFAKGQINVNSIEASLTTVFDYHPQGGDNTNTENLKHRAKYNFPVSKEFKFWLSGNGTEMSQSDFARLLEERYMEMTVATEDEAAAYANQKARFAEPLEILRLAEGLEIYSQETVTQNIRLQSGECKLQFSTHHTDAKGDPLSIPDFFMLRLPVFVGDAPIRVPVRLRYRKKGQGLVWFYELYRVDQVFECAFESAIEDVKAKTELPLYLGSPSA